MTTYNIPTGLTFTKMAMYFDEHLNDKERDDGLLYQYVYHLVYMLARQKNYFQEHTDYDAFALYAATKIYLRAINQPSEDSDSQTKPIKSILNYTKAVLYPLKVDFQKETYEEIINPNIDNRINGDKLLNNIHNAIQSDYQWGLFEEIFSQLESLPRYIEEVVQESPYKNDVLTARRLYMSILISFLKGITISNPGLEKVKRREDKNLKTDDVVLKMLEKERENSTTVWRLKDSMLNYVEVLTNKVRKKFGQDLIELSQSFLLDDAELESVVMSAYQGDSRDNNEEF